MNADKLQLPGKQETSSSKRCRKSERLAYFLYATERLLANNNEIEAILFIWVY